MLSEQEWDEWLEGWSDGAATGRVKKAVLQVAHTIWKFFQSHLQRPFDRFGAADILAEAGVGVQLAKIILDALEALHTGAEVTGESDSLADEFQPEFFEYRFNGKLYNCDQRGPHTLPCPRCKPACGTCRGSMGGCLLPSECYLYAREVSYSGCAKCKYFGACPDCKPKQEARDELRHQGAPIFSGDDSKQMWDQINGAKTIRDLRQALYGLGCKLQDFETRLDECVGSERRK